MVVPSRPTPTDGPFPGRREGSSLCLESHEMSRAPRLSVVLLSLAALGLAPALPAAAQMIQRQSTTLLMLADVRKVRVGPRRRD